MSPEARTSARLGLFWAAHLPRCVSKAEDTDHVSESRPSRHHLRWPELARSIAPAAAPLASISAPRMKTAPALMFRLRRATASRSNSGCASFFAGCNYRPLQAVHSHRRQLPGLRLCVMLGDCCATSSPDFCTAGDDLENAEVSFGFSDRPRTSRARGALPRARCTRRPRTSLGRLDASASPRAASSIGAWKALNGQVRPGREGPHRHRRCRHRRR